MIVVVFAQKIQQLQNKRELVFYPLYSQEITNICCNEFVKWRDWTYASFVDHLPFRKQELCRDEK
jgi:hypothetical protein